MFAFRSLKGRHLPTRSFKYVLAPSQRSISSSPAQLGKTVDATTTSTELVYGQFGTVRNSQGKFTVRPEAFKFTTVNYRKLTCL